MTNSRFQVNLRGVIELLSGHLYSDPSVFVRELLQNAVDAISARRQLEPDFAGQVALELVESADGPQTIVTRDNGIGLTVEEVHEFLATIGSSSKRDDDEISGERSTFIGQFGIGILSCFMVSDEIVVVSRSARSPDAAAVEWRGRSDGSYAVRELTGVSTPGTEVYLRIRPEAVEENDIFTFDKLVELGRRFGEMLRMEISVRSGEQQTQIERAQTPWELAKQGDIEALREYAREALGFEPLDMLPLKVEAGGIEGVAFVLPTPATVNDYGCHIAYLRGMLIGEVYGLLPKWAKFTRCVVNADSLRPTASREAFQHGPDLDAAETEFGRSLRRYLVDLVRNNPALLTTLLNVHDVAIRTLALEDNEFFDTIIDLLEFETTLGPLRFGEFRRENELIRVARTGEQYRRIAPVAIAHGQCVFNGGYAFHEELLQRASERCKGLIFQRVDSADLIGALLPVEDEHAEAAAALLDVACEALADFAAQPVLRCFKPASLPAFFGLATDAEFQRSVDRTKANARGHWQEMLAALQPADAPPPSAYLCLNWQNALIQKLIRSGSRLQRAMLQVLYVQALMMGQYPLSVRESRLLSDALGEVLQERLGEEAP